MNPTTTYILLNIFLVTIETLIAAYLPGGFFSKRRSRTFFSLSFVLFAIMANLSSLFWESLLLTRIIFFIVICSTWICLNYKTSILKSVFTAILVASLQTIVDDAFVTIAIHFSLEGAALINDPIAYYFLCYASKLLSLLIAVVICTWSKQRLRRYTGTWANWLRILFFPVATLSVAVFLTRILSKAPQLAGELLGCSFVLLIADLMSILLLNYFEKQQNAVLENTVLRQNLKLESEHIISIQEAYAQQRKQTHDFNYQLAVLRNMADRGASQKEFTDYLNHILAIEFPTVTYLNTHRLVVDVILSQKSAVAASKHISFNWKLDDLSSFPLSDDALVIVLTNLIDNAVEACELITDESRRRILLKMQVKSANAILYIENTTSEPVNIRDNHIETTKSDRLSHGYGLKNVCSTIAASGGFYVLHYRPEGVFCFSAKLPTT